MATIYDIETTFSGVRDKQRLRRLALGRYWPPLVSEGILWGDTISNVPPPGSLKKQINRPNKKLLLL